MYSAKTEMCVYTLTMFVIHGCAFCDAAKIAVQKLPSVPGRTVDVVHVDGRHDIRERLASKTGCRTLPSVWIGNEYIGGLNTGPPPFGGLARVIANNLWDVARAHH